MSLLVTSAASNVLSLLEMINLEDRYARTVVRIMIINMIAGVGAGTVSIATESKIPISLRMTCHIGSDIPYNEVEQPLCWNPNPER